MSSTSATGTIDPPDQSMGLSGLSATLIVGTGVIISANPEIELTGLSMTASTGILDPADQVMGLTGVSVTASTGALNPADVKGS